MANAEMAWRAYDLAMKHHDHFNMDTWIAGDDHDDDLVQGVGGLLETCGTTACLAGWVAALAGDTLSTSMGMALPYGHDSSAPQFAWRTIWGRAKRLLDIDGAQANAVFLCQEEDLLENMIRVFGSRPSEKAELVSALLES